ncbi:diaminopimelate decarboxylase [Calditrichota bacterium]
MPIRQSFAERLQPRLNDIAAEFGTPFHIYDEAGIIETGERLKAVFGWNRGFREFFAVKALPNPAIMRIMQGLDFGFDCSSIAELQMSRGIGARTEDIMFTSNNTSDEQFDVALSDGGCILNLDDLSMIDKVPDFPDFIIFRYNPGPTRDGNEIIGKPVEAKYGLRTDQVVEAYRRAQERGATRFGLHTMVCSNVLDYRYMNETVAMLLEVVQQLKDELDIRIECINLGGGIGIPYHPDHYEFDLEALGKQSRDQLEQFESRSGFMPKIFMELGRWMTGPHGVLATTVRNRLSKYREYIGVDASMSSLMRPGMYGAYHHITVPAKEGGATEMVDVVGSLCENNDKFAIQRQIPVTEVGDIMLIHDTGAHGQAMGFNYNGVLRPKELLMRSDGSVELIRRAETVDDYLATLQFEGKVWR